MQQTPFRIATIQDDSEDNRLLARIFARDEFDVSSFETPRELIQYMRIQPVPHCVITDLTIKESSGVELIEKIRHNARWKDVPILVLAKSVSKQELIELNRLKINSYIVKPYQPPRLFSDVLKLMGLEVVTEKKAVKRKVLKH
jgi:two-component system chemotaxis response regulator CheY